MKYLIVGLGNIGEEYKHTRHNIGFQILDALAKASNIVFETKRYGDVSVLKYKGRQFILLKPSTYMNLSGNAVNYWLQKEKVRIENLFVISDDLAIPFGKIRIRAKGSDGGHNGLKHINQTINNTHYARLRFGIGNQFKTGKQVDYVLGKWTDEELSELDERIDYCTKAILSFGTIGINRTMNLYNNK